jgi:hypothetical protein
MTLGLNSVVNRARVNAAIASEHMAIAGAPFGPVHDDLPLLDVPLAAVCAGKDRANKPILPTPGSG